MCARRHPPTMDAHKIRNGSDPEVVVIVSVQVVTAREPIRLLVVDDDARVRRAIEQTLCREHDLELVAQAGDIENALAAAERERPRVALVDVLLPDVQSGLALIYALSCRPDCTVVAMSVADGQREVAVARGAVAFVTKDGNIDAVLAAVRAAGSAVSD
jgi:DNA-binding NarL/FixJ family response regulator